MGGGYPGASSGFGGGFPVNGEGFYEYAPGFSYDTSTRASSVAGVAWNNMQAAEEVSRSLYRARTAPRTPGQLCPDAHSHALHRWQLLTSLELAKEQMDAFTENLRKYLAKYIQDKVVRSAAQALTHARAVVGVPGLTLSRACYECRVHSSRCWTGTWSSSCSGASTASSCWAKSSLGTTTTSTCVGPGHMCGGVS